MFETEQDFTYILTLAIAVVAVPYFYFRMFANVFMTLFQGFRWMLGRFGAEIRPGAWLNAVVRQVADEGPLSGGFIPSAAYLVLWALIFFTSLPLLV